MAFYQCVLDLHLPKDEDFGREEAYNSKVPVQADNPNDLVQRVIYGVVAKSGFASDINYLAGLIVTIVNRMPPEFRQACVNGIKEGASMTIIANKGDVRAEMTPTFDPLPDEHGDVRRASGLIVPGGAV